MTTPLLLDIGKHPDEPMHARLVLPLPARTPFGNFSRKYEQIILRLDHANRTILRIHADHASMGNTPCSHLLTSHVLQQEEVVYWIRRAADELVSLVSVLTQWQSTGSCPRQVPVDCIGAFIDENKHSLTLDQMAFLNLLNDVSNAYKHSFIHSEISRVGLDEPVVFALALKRNKLDNDSVFYCVRLNDIITGFNVFFVSQRQTLQACTLPHLP